LVENNRCQMPKSISAGSAYRAERPEAKRLASLRSAAPEFAPPGFGIKAKLG